MLYYPKLHSFLLLCFLLLPACLSYKTDLSSSVHDILSQYGLPKGLLPDTVSTYSLANDGSFAIKLKKPCYVQFDDLVYYDKKITGKLSYGSITNLSGIQAKKLFIWVSVTGIQAEPADNLIEFHVGFVSEKLPAEQFENIPTCKSNAYGQSLRGEPLIVEV